MDRSTGVRWFSPAVLAKTGALTAGFTLLDSYLDKRELQAGLPASHADPPPAPGANGFVPTLDLRGVDRASDLWISFGADTGDADASTTRFARAFLGPLLVGPPGSTGSADRGAEYPPSDLVILGGDQVYPAASKRDYRDRFLDPWLQGSMQAGNPATPVVALPGNHDWYDGLTAFLRIFTQGGHLGGSDCTLAQGRSYWTVRLPGNLWIWGADIEFGSDVDGPQRAYFDAAADSMRADGPTKEHPKAGEPGRVILCVSKPFWYFDAEDRQLNVAFLEHLVERRGGTVVAMLTGDQHHYVHLQDTTTGQRRITSGGGGAFCHPTHQVVDKGAKTAHHLSSPATELEPREATVPSRDESRRMGRGLVWFGLRNPSFLLVPAALALVYLMIAATTPQVRFELGDGSSVSRSLSQAMGSLASVRAIATVLLGSPAAILLDAVLIGLLTAFAMPGGSKDRSLKVKIPLGVFHGALWLAAMGLAVWCAAQVAVRIDWGTTFWTVILSMAFGALFGTVAMTAYLCVSWGVCGWNGNEAFSAIRRTDLVHLLRLHVVDGEVTVHPIVLDPAPGSGGSGPVTAALIEDPYVLASVPSAKGAS